MSRNNFSGYNKGLKKPVIYHKPIHSYKAEDIAKKSFFDFWWALFDFERVNCYCGAKGNKHIRYVEKTVEGTYSWREGYKSIRMPIDETGDCHCDCHEKDILEEI